MCASGDLVIGMAYDTEVLLPFTPDMAWMVISNRETQVFTSSKSMTWRAVVKRFFSFDD